jgi:hypothetical protein
MAIATHCPRPSRGGGGGRAGCDGLLEPELEKTEGLRVGIGGVPCCGPTPGGIATANIPPERWTDALLRGGGCSPSPVPTPNGDTYHGPLHG